MMSPKWPSKLIIRCPQRIRSLILSVYRSSAIVGPFNCAEMHTIRNAMILPFTHRFCTCLNENECEHMDCAIFIQNLCVCLCVWKQHTELYLFSISRLLAATYSSHRFHRVLQSVSSKHLWILLFICGEMNIIPVSALSHPNILLHLQLLYEWMA